MGSVPESLRLGNDMSLDSCSPICAYIQTCASHLEQLKKCYAEDTVLCYNQDTVTSDVFFCRVITN